MIDRSLDILLNCIDTILNILYLIINLLNGIIYFSFLFKSIFLINSNWWEQSIKFNLFILIKLIYFILVQCFILGICLNKKLIFFFWADIYILLHLLSLFSSLVHLYFQILDLVFYIFNLTFYFFWLLNLFCWVFGIQNIVNIDFLNIWV
jgi:hypothetical protein